MKDAAISDVDDERGKTAPGVSTWRRVAQAVRRHVIVVSTLAAVLVGLDIGLVFAIHRWQHEAADLRVGATYLGEQVARERAVVEHLAAEAALESDQRSAAEDRASVLATEVSFHRTHADEYRDVAVAFDACWRDRDTIVHGLWSHGRGSVSDLTAQTTQECSDATTTLTSLQAAEG
jgi:hypothetical protein